MPSHYSSTHDADAPLPPSNIDAERKVLAALLTNNIIYDQIAFLRSEHFDDPDNSALYGAIAQRIEAGEPADATIMRSKFAAAYLANLLSAMWNPGYIESYAREIERTWKLRRVIEVCARTVKDAYHAPSDHDAAELVETLDREISTLSGAASANDGPIPVEEAVTRAIEEGDANRRGERLAAASTGLPSVDKAILGLRPGNLIVVGGRPGVGKTSAARSIAVNVALGETIDSASGEVVLAKGGPQMVAYFSMEEEDVEFGAAVLAQLAGVSIAEVLDGTSDIAAADRIVKEQRRLVGKPLFIFRKPRQSLRDIATRCRHLIRAKKQRLALVVVDYLQLMADPPGMKEKRLAVGQNAYGLKEIAKEFGCAVMALSQLSRAVEDREDKRPTMRDLRETGEIEDAADVILFPYRPEYYLRRERPQIEPGQAQADYARNLADWEAKIATVVGKAELIIPKVRRGKAPTQVDLFFDAKRTRFEEAR